MVNLYICFSKSNTICCPLILSSNAHENRNRLANEHYLAAGKAEIYNTELDSSKSELAAVEEEIQIVNKEIDDYQRRLTRYPGIPPYDDPNPSMTSILGKSSAPPPTPITESPAPPTLTEQM